MSQLVIEIDNADDEALLLQLLPKLSARVVGNRTTPKPNSNEQLVDILERLSKSSIAEKYGDPSEWQRETRQDRPLPGREE